MAKYVKCDCCGKRIHFGEEVWRFDGHARLCCSEVCFANSYGVESEMTYELAEDCWSTIYDDEAEAIIKSEIAKAKSEIALLEEKLKGLEQTLKMYD